LKLNSFEDSIRYPSLSIIEMTNPDFVFELYGFLTWDTEKDNCAPRDTAEVKGPTLSRCLYSSNSHVRDDGKVVIPLQSGYSTEIIASR